MRMLIKPKHGQESCSRVFEVYLVGRVSTASGGRELENWVDWGIQSLP